MTFDEVVTKWSRKHRTALLDVLPEIKAGKTPIIVPKKKARNCVTTQIFNDFGYKLTKVGRFEGEKAFFKYEKREETLQENK